MLSFLQLLVLCFSFSQETTSLEGTNSWSLQTGTLLPNNTRELDELQSATLLRYTFHETYQTSILYSNSNDIQVYAFSVGAYWNKSVDSFHFQLQAGADVTMIDASDINFYVGFYAANAFMIEISESWLFRSDLKLTIEPGANVLILFGFEYRIL